LHPRGTPECIPKTCTEHAPFGAVRAVRAAPIAANLRQKTLLALLKSGFPGPMRRRKTVGPFRAESDVATQKPHRRYRKWRFLSVAVDTGDTRVKTKSEIRNSKSETNTKSEEENPKRRSRFSGFCIFRFGLSFGFVSDFAFRISDFLHVVSRALSGYVSSHDKLIFPGHTPADHADDVGLCRAAYS
jgi:hypothetical protein